MFAPGFRISVTDALVLIVGSIASFIVGTQVWWAGIVVAFVVGHFFLFCNVFRVRRKPELVWASLFVLLAASTVLTEKPGWMVTFAVSFLVAVMLIYRETKMLSYHGVGWQRLNPGLLEWWEKKRESH